MQYNGKDVELITEGYWPEGVTLICSDDGVDWNVNGGIVCLHNCVVFYNSGECGQTWEYWALIPAKQAPRRLTNREVGKLASIKYDLKYRHGTIYCNAEVSYSEGNENEACDVDLVAVRAPNSDEWLDPTSDLLEVGE